MSNTQGAHRQKERIIGRSEFASKGGSPTMKGPTGGFVLPVSSAQNIHAKELYLYIADTMMTIEWL